MRAYQSTRVPKGSVSSVVYSFVGCHEVDRPEALETKLFDYLDPCNFYMWNSVKWPELESFVDVGDSI